MRPHATKGEEMKPVAEDLANRIAARVLELARGQNASSAS